MLTTLAAITLAFAPANDDPATLLPESTLVYIGTGSAQASSEAARGSAMSKIMAEPEMRAFLQKPMAAADGVLAVLLDQGKQMVEANKPADLDMDVDLDQEFSLFDLLEESDLPVGQTFFAITHLDLGAETGVPDIGFVVGVQLLEDGNLEHVRKLWDGVPGSQTTKEHGGIEYFSKVPDGQPMALNLSVLDDLAVFSTSESALHGVMDRSTSETPMASLATTPDYTSLLSKTGGVPVAGSASFTRLGELVGVMNMGIAAGMAANGMESELGQVMPLLAGLGLDGLEWAGSVSHRDSDGHIHGTEVVKVDKSAPGILSQMMSSSRPLDLSRLQDIPATAGSVSGTSISGLGALYDYIDSSIKSIAPDEYEQGMGMVQAMLGDVDLRNDLFANIDGDVWSYSLPGMGPMGASAGVTTIDMKNPERFMNAFERLIDVVNENFSEAIGGGTIGLNRSVHADHAFYELDLSRTPAGAMASMGMSPSMAIKDGELWMSFESATALRTALNGELGESSIVDNKEFVAFLDDLRAKGGSDELSSIGFQDVAQSFDEQYTQLAQMAAMMGSGMGDIPVDFSMLPGSKTITQHLGQSYSGQTLGSDDGLMVTQSRSQFDPGDFMPLILTAGLLGVAQQMGIDASSTVVEEVSPFELAQEDISQLRAGVTIFRIATGKAPTSLDDLVRPLPDYPDGSLASPELPIDPWGNGYMYKLNGRKGTVWSKGPNGIDDDGKGDDIVRKR